MPNAKGCSITCWLVAEPPNKLATKQIELRLPKKDLARLQHFAVRELPKAASNTAVIDRVLTALDQAWHRHERPSHAASSGC